MLQKAERESHKDLSDNYVLQRSLLAYVEAAKLVSGRVLELERVVLLVDVVSPNANRMPSRSINLRMYPFWTYKNHPSIKFMQMVFRHFEVIRKIIHLICNNFSGD
ncbi:MAG: hypothetical protein IPG39_11770 [Bacteroidetes bacterium]|nr:hypothetical protein [Bacteroidota bacterium]